MHTIYSYMYALVKDYCFLLLGAKRQSNIGLTGNSAPKGLGAQFANERSERKLRDKGIIRLKQLLGQFSFFALTPLQLSRYMPWHKQYLR